MKVRRIFTIVLAIILALTLTTVAFATAPMQILVNTLHCGYTVIGKGSATSTAGSVSLTAGASSGTAGIPSDECTCSAKVEGYTSSGTYLGSTERTGTTAASATFTDSIGRISYTKSTFTFVGQTYGPYTVTV